MPKTVKPVQVSKDVRVGINQTGVSIYLQSDPSVSRVEIPISKLLEITSAMLQVDSLEPDDPRHAFVKSVAGASKTYRSMSLWVKPAVEMPVSYELAKPAKPNYGDADEEVAAEEEDDAVG